MVDHIIPPKPTEMSVGECPSHLYDIGPKSERVYPESWEQVPLAPPDSIFKLTAAYKADTFPQKVNLGAGAYRDDNSKPWVLPVVRKASARVICNPAISYWLRPHSTPGH